MPKLCLLHGLFGLSNNWLGISKHLQDEFHILAPDLRNHGRSPYHDLMDFTLRGEDLLGLFDQLDLDSVIFLGTVWEGREPSAWRCSILGTLTSLSWPTRLQ
ncbi:MAG: alpha/beta fold hydrolase [Candidatus Thiodiazotropha sp. (ex Lucinoma aequizonata)]|nr:alpha/beta fold hydrolase [Candidatus Thiodiazotropha sp. (ex Lucinoma aequizonata)]MCU7889927.1 alpha/beta fold hydrolase [Candidatus Thiodiazotropha sp. (ex Lucinoma aequizonata)]MCU7897147.1 alpha/beta fold hydrolase [Candidatus Thiodiazotropha sp. (ex Lucinoma aequizonata)]MCU7899158.1 alpha/beta fold hydrolase [Candidatus Thiodiazotropha sp. (ex Lucinoma aequizonata)]MCU7901142.1 alpha/beta fold hydrolase [Candidatus Thiodiazotropha sp. (ex Lucinoma aequizonata)]